MAEFTLSKRIDAPAESVFDIVADIERLPEVVRAITKMELVTEGPVGVGTRFRETRVVMKREHTEEMEISRFDRPRGYTTLANSCGCRYDSELIVNEKPGGGCELEIRFKATPLNFVAKAMSFMLGFMMNSCKKATEQDLDDIKAVAEASAGNGK